MRSAIPLYPPVFTFFIPPACRNAFFHFEFEDPPCPVPELLFTFYARYLHICEFPRNIFQGKGALRKIRGRRFNYVNSDAREAYVKR